MAIKASRIIYCYNDDGTFIGEYASINTAASVLQTPKTSIVKSIDKKVFDEDKNTCRAKRIYSKHLNKLIFFRSQPIKNVPWQKPEKEQ